MHPIELRDKARKLHRSGMSFRAIGRLLGVRYDAVRYWCVVTQTPDSHWQAKACPRCEQIELDGYQYAYLLGQYLGDGHIALTERVPKLRITCADAYPRIMDECETSMRAVLAKSVFRTRKIGCTDLVSYSTHWPCVFPQAGLGHKHERPIILEEWQREVVREHPGRLARGLFHSDGCRSMNNVMVRGKQYSYPRYFFSDTSPDILAICGDALDLLGVEWRLNRRNSLSVAKRDAVSILDRHVSDKT